MHITMGNLIIKCILILLLVIRVSLVSNAQKDSIVNILKNDSAKLVGAKPSIKKSKFFRPNNLNINLYGVLVNNYSFAYERTISNRIALQLGYRFQPYNYLLNIIPGKFLSERGAVPYQYYNFKIANNAVTSDVRYYLRKRKQTSGIFIGLYARYSHFDIDDIEYTYIGDDKNVYNIPLITNLDGIGGGFTLGCKWVIKKRISVEYYSGIHYLQLHGNLSCNKDLSGLSDHEKQNVQRNVEDLFTFSDKKYITTTINDNGIRGKVTGPSLGFRSGLTLGFSF
jgi:hypothetical protein